MGAVDTSEFTSSFGRFSENSKAPLVGYGRVPYEEKSRQHTVERRLYVGFGNPEVVDAFYLGCFQKLGIPQNHPFQ